MATCGEFQLHPQYRVPRPLDALLLKAQSGLDDFPTERYADQIGAILSAWSSRLLESPQDVKAIAEVLLPNFLGASLSPAESRTLRPGPAIVVHSNRFSREAKLNRETFLLELRSSLSRFSKLLTAEFQVTSIDAVAMSAGSAAATQIQTRIRYELLGTGSDCYGNARPRTRFDSCAGPDSRKHEASRKALVMSILRLRRSARMLPMLRS